MKTRIIAVMIISIVTITSAFAQTRSDVRQKSQRARIHEGRQQGEVTKKEAQILNMQQRHINRTELKAKSDGCVTARENAVIERKQDKASRSIYRARHNAVERKQ